MVDNLKLSRRQLLKTLSATTALAVAPRHSYAGGNTGANKTHQLKPIPKTGELIPVIGMGSWITFNVGRNPEALKVREEVLRTFFAAGGGVIDSSPMYGSSEAVIGHCLERLKFPDSMFNATKVWTSGEQDGKDQIAEAHGLWKIKKFDLLQIHNLVDWQTHLETLLEMKKAGSVRYIGVTTSHGRRHRDLETILETEPIDFVQLTYNIDDRDVEKRLLPVAKERNLAVIANRPFQRGGLFARVRNTPLPNWASDVYCQNWAEFFLKFVVSHPSITCAIPATSKVAHMTENMAVLRGQLPDPDMRKKMSKFFATI